MIPLLALPGRHDDIGVVLGRVATELAALTAVSEDLQDLFGTMTSAKTGEAGLHADTLRSFQSLDLLTQTLDSLSRFMMRLGADSKLRASLDLTQALQLVSLSALAARLAGTGVEVDPDMEFDLF